MQEVAPFPFGCVLFANPMVSLEITGFCVGYDGKLYLASSKNDCVFILSQSQPIKMCIVDRPCALVALPHGDIAVLSQKPGNVIYVSVIDAGTGAMISSFERSSCLQGLVKGMCLDNSEWLIIKRTGCGHPFGADCINANTEETFSTMVPNLCESFVCVPDSDAFIEVAHENYGSTETGSYRINRIEDMETRISKSLPAVEIRKGVPAIAHMVVVSTTHVVLLRDRTLTRIDMRTLDAKGHLVLPKSLPPGLSSLNGHSGKVGDCRYSGHMAVDIDGLLYIPVYVERQFTKKGKQYGPGLVSILTIHPERI